VLRAALLGTLGLASFPALFVDGAGRDLFGSTGLSAFLIGLLDMLILPFSLRAFQSSWRHFVLL
jgi:hypothetical protein